MVDFFFFFRLLIYMYAYRSHKLYIGINQKTEKPKTIVTWNVKDIDYKIVIDKLKILDADIVHLQGVFNNKWDIIEEFRQIYFNIVTDDHKQYYIFKDCGMVIMTKCMINSYNFKSYGDWYSRINRGYIFYSIDKLNFCNCYIDMKDDDNTLTKLHSIIKSNPYGDNFFIGGYIKYNNIYQLFGIKPNNSLSNIEGYNNNYLISLGKNKITNNIYDFKLNENPIIGIIQI